MVWLGQGCLLRLDTMEALKYTANVVFISMDSHNMTVHYDVTAYWRKLK